MDDANARDTCHGPCVYSGCNKRQPEATNIPLNPHNATRLSLALPLPLTQRLPPPDRRSRNMVVEGGLFWVWVIFLTPEGPRGFHGIGRDETSHGSSRAMERAQLPWVLIRVIGTATATFRGHMVKGAQITHFSLQQDGCNRERACRALACVNARANDARTIWANVKRKEKMKWFLSVIYKHVAIFSNKIGAF